VVNSISTDSTITRSEFGHAWRDKAGIAHAAVWLGQATITFSGEPGPALARAVAAACTQAAEAMEALPPAQDGAR
jgi:hypothetical protein